ncbi:hypothetical protein E5358_08465 [Palleniella muris]|uniref:Uncharacterized protein n=1 Tax=Palleniella muris TaxID=3038145 RepID=A0AC61QPT5_9BACT|nr:GrpB family protein [Palleniella muris]TGX82082.1 hypothetical protein E5358_08465 [Palleniella muris]
MPQHITVTDYNPAWPDLFEEEAKRIRKILSNNCKALYHIGSTAVPGLAAKPILRLKWWNWSPEKIFDNMDVLCSGNPEGIKQFQK